jgi:hypothetical protein
LKAVAQTTAAEIEARYTDADLERLIKAKGLESTTLPPTTPTEP